ncbi:hypothetical protein C2845_PM02G11090 [Panicum miliaceum]|uniref:Uncharacterized protein n=1 Tax=Panicum miliaceum TaxID=4540 RepID=A0A3L6SDV2_PANMI|nr:hypothetical protein C2845_PM02G11090 [Panicum miliaceum]
MVQDASGEEPGLMVLNWMQIKLHGLHGGRRKSEFIADPAWPETPTCTPRLAVDDSSSGLPQTDKLNDGWTAAVSERFGMREGHRLKSCGRLDELSSSCRRN